MFKSRPKQKKTKELLNNRTQCERISGIPGNFQAKQRRAKHEDSKLVFPASKRREPENFKTNYTLNFKTHKKARPSSPRPCSPTRRNNPHPSMNFLNWRIPTRVYDYGKERHANVKFLRENFDDTYQSFYDDYRGIQQRSLDPKHLIEFARTYTIQNRKQRQPKKKEQGYKVDETLASILRRNWSPDLSAINPAEPKKEKRSAEKGTSQDVDVKNQSCYTSPMYNVHSSESCQPLFRSWYDAACATQTEKRKETPDPVRAEAEEKYLSEALEMALQPDAIEALEDWLLDASEEERTIAVQFIKAIILASVEEKKKATSATSPTQGKSPTQKFAPEKPKVKKHHHRNPLMKKTCAVCQHQELEGALHQLSKLPYNPWGTPAITEILNPLHPSIIKDKESRRKYRTHRPRQPPPKFEPNKGSVFAQSVKPRYRHFTIHPEWQP